MRGSSLLPYERFPSIPKGTNWGRLLCGLKARRRDLFVCILTCLSSVLPAGLLSGPDQDIPFIFWSLALRSDALSHSACLRLCLPLGLCSSLIAFPFAVLWAARGTTEGGGKARSLFPVPACTCLLGFRVKCIGTAAAQHKGAGEAEILTAVKCSWKSMWEVRLFERLAVGEDLIEFSQGSHKRHLWCKGNCCNKVQASVSK